ncbi:MAG: hydrolase, partial [Bacteroidetes bacterium]
MKTTTLFFILANILFGFPYFSFAQNQAQQTQYKLQKTKEPIVLDGKLNENSWKTAAVATDFYMTIPNDDRPATMDSEVRMTYDEENFYFAITCFDGQDGYVVQSLRRDWDGPLNENFTIFL